MPALKVALLEAGPRDKNFLIHMPAGYPALMKTGIVDWGYHTEPQAGMNGRALFWPRGRVLGGSSSVNAMIYIRGVPSDYDLWAQLGNRGWSWDDVLPYFKKAETYLPGADAHHGSGGPLKVSRPGITGPLSLAWIEAGKQAGHPYTNDFNGASQEGFGPIDCTVADGRRASAAACYLTPVLERPNLTVIARAQATRILIENGRAVGVEYARKKQRHEIRARPGSDPLRRLDQFPAASPFVRDRPRRRNRLAPHQARPRSAGRWQEPPGSSARGGQA